MAKRAITNEGILCSVCGAIVQSETKICYQCDSPLEGEFRAVICSACGSIAPAENQTCPFCGVDLSQAQQAHVKPVPREVDTDIVSVVEDVTSEIMAPSAPISAKNAIIDRLKRMNNALLALDNAISKKSWTDLTSIKNTLSELIEDSMSILVSIKELGGDASRIEELQQKEKEIEEKMKELERTAELREKEALKLKEKEKELLVKEQVLDDRSEAIAAKSEEITRIRAALEKKEKELNAREMELKEMEKKIEETIVSRAKEGGSPPPIPSPPGEGVQTKAISEGIDRAKALTTQLINYFKKRTADDSAKIVIALEKINTQLDSITIPDLLPVPASGSSPQVQKETEQEREELRQVLKALDTLLENLPEEVIARFANSEEFKLYERVLDRYGV